MKLLVSGCSITHGAELHNGFMSTLNIEQSFSADLAARLNLELVNVALSGGSNEYIFHSIIENLEKHNNIDTVLVVWTALHRLYWKNNQRHYFFLPGWVSSMTNLENFKMHDRLVNNVWITGDNEPILDALTDAHKFFIAHHYDEIEMAKKLKHYKISLRHICQAQGIKYFDIDFIEFGKGTTWMQESRHPNKQEHKVISEFLYNKFFS